MEMESDEDSGIQQVLHNNVLLSLQQTRNHGDCRAKKAKSNILKYYGVANLELSKYANNPNFRRLFGMDYDELILLHEENCLLLPEFISSQRTDVSRLLATLIVLRKAVEINKSIDLF